MAKKPPTSPSPKKGSKGGKSNPQGKGGKGKGNGVAVPPKGTLPGM